MSWQAMTAVSHHSKQNGDAFRLLLHLAEYAHPDGSIDPAPNQLTLAQHFECTDRTIRNRINALGETGELTQTRVGKGPGNSSAYQINLLMPQGSGLYKPERKQGKQETNPPTDSGFETAVQTLNTKVSLLQTQMNTLMALPEINALLFPVSKEEKPESKTGNTGKIENDTGKTGKKNRKGHSGKSADDPSLIQIDPLIDLGEGTPSPSVHPKMPFPEGENEQAMAGSTALWTWLEAGLSWPGWKNAAFIIGRLGNEPNMAALVKARTLWLASGNKPANVLGICDWYDAILADPTWSPIKRFNKNSSGGNKSGATAADVIAAALEE